MPAVEPADLECLTDSRRAAALLDPLRARILTLARGPASATQLGVRLNLPRQRVNYHVRELARAGLLKRAGSDTASPAYLLALSAQMQADLARASRGAKAAGKLLATLSIKSQFRFESPEQRQRFTKELRDALVAVIARFTSPNLSADGKAAAGQPYRLVLGCYPYTPEEAAPQEEGP